MKNLLFLLSILLFSTSSLKAQEKFTITVNVSGISNIEGTIYASLTNDASSFPKVQNPLYSKAVKVEGDKVTFEFEEVLGGGDYAVVLFQDLDNDEKMGMNGSMPAEPFGFSNYVMMGPPTWEDCSFELNKNKETTVRLYSF
ncbi:DUF2141 domain-containing protein [uncultured Arcticibacterium sp.]|uniref:DUF2141 domain-containing protein n=1 Tax=uncultured Arcticibacterium sp. TaxID=2173042 RepID=UPI0030F5FB03